MTDFMSNVNTKSVSATPAYIFLNLQEFAFEGQNMTFTVNVLFTCIIYCDARPGYN